MANKPKESNSQIKTKSKGSPFLAALFKVLGTLIIVLILCISIPAALPRILGYELFNIVSGSMEPTIPVGAAVYVQKSDPSKLEAGNIIAFEVNGDVVVHRITQNDTAAQEIHTKGDANDAEDMWGVPYNNVYGRVRVSVRMLGSFLDFSTSSTGKLFVFMILFAGIVFSILGKILTPPDEFEDYDEPKDTKRKLKVEDKPKLSENTEPIKEESKAITEEAPKPAVEEKPRTLSESTGIKRTITVEDAVNNNVDESIIAEAPSYAEAELDKPITLKDLAKRSSRSADESNSVAQKVEVAAAAATTLSEVKAKEALAAPAPSTVQEAVSTSTPSSGKSVLLQLADEVEAERNKNGYIPDEVKTEDEPITEEKPLKTKKDKKSAKKKDKKAVNKAKNESVTEPKAETKSEPKKNSKAEDEKYKKMLSAIIIIIIILIVALLGVVGTIFFINYRYNQMDAVNEDVVSQFTSEATEDEVIEIAEEPADDKFVLHTTQKCPIDVDFEALWEVNPDVVGWIYCEDTVINYPILQGEDDEYYLHHDINGKTSSAGCIFIDCNNMKDFTDVNSILYGHHMKNGSMFAGLQKWEEQEYYDAHKYMWIITPDGNYEVWLFSGYLTDAFSDSYLGIRNWGDMAEEYITTAYNNSDFVSDLKLETMMKCAEDDQRHVMLSTCEYEFQNARYVLHGKLVKETPGIYGNDLENDNLAPTETPDDSVTEDTASEDTEAVVEDESDVNFNNLAEVKQVKNSVSNTSMGNYSVHRFDSARCTTDFLTKWYTDYIKQNDNLLWNVIYYSDKDDNSGIYYSNKLIEKDVILDNNGTIADFSNEKQYIISNDTLVENELP